MIPSKFAHVDYVTEPEPSPDPIGFLVEALGHRGSIPLLAIGAAVALAAILV